MPTPTAVLAMLANNPGCRGCAAPTAEDAAGGCAGTAAGTFAGTRGGGGALRLELKPLSTHGSMYKIIKYTTNKKVKD